MPDFYPAVQPDNPPPDLPPLTREDPKPSPRCDNHAGGFITVIWVNPNLPCPLCESYEESKRLLAEVERLEKAVLSVPEWDSYNYVCNFCGREQAENHAPDCTWKLLKERAGAN